MEIIANITMENNNRYRHFNFKRYRNISPTRRHLFNDSRDERISRRYREDVSSLQNT